MTWVSEVREAPCQGCGWNVVFDEFPPCPHGTPVCETCDRWTACVQCVTDQAERVDVEYRSPEWYEVRRDAVSASEVAAILGLSPWVSPFDLWWAKRTGVDSQPEDDEMRRGRRLEPMVVEDFAAAHPELSVAPSMTVRNTSRPWQVATPDGLAHESLGVMTHEEDGTPVHYDGEPVAAIEAKTAFSRSEWGEPGTDAIPVYYRCQVLWQMDTLGLNLAYVPVWFGTQFAEYVVEYDEGDAKVLRDAAWEFLASVREDRMPDVDASTATARRLKVLHPQVEDTAVEVPPYIIAQYHAAKRLRDAAEARMRLAENRLRMGMGNSRIAVIGDSKVASRSVYDVKERTQTVRAHTVHRLTITPSHESDVS